MKVVVLLVAVLGCTLASPIEILEDIELHRAKKSSYGPPCAGAAPYAPVALYLGPNPQQPQYREDENNHDNTEHKEDPKARSYYPLAGLPSAVNYGGAEAGAPVVTSYSGAGGSSSAVPSIPSYSSGAATASGSAGAGHGPGAIGLFPHAQIGGCNIPLLLSCAPNVITGHLAESHHSGYAVPAYRETEHEAHMEDWAKMARQISHHKVSEDYPEPHPGNHHVVSHDYPEPNLTHIVPVQPGNKPSGHH